MNRAALVVVGIALALPASAAVSPSTPYHHHVRVRHRQPVVSSLPTATTAQVDAPLAHHIPVPGANPNADRPSAEWDCNGRGGECSWEPSGWGGRND